MTVSMCFYPIPCDIIIYHDCINVLLSDTMLYWLKISTYLFFICYSKCSIKGITEYPRYIKRKLNCKSNRKKQVLTNINH